MSQQTDREYQEELRQLRESLILMAGHVEQMIGSAKTAIVEQNPVVARQTILEDKKVNQAEVDTDELCLRILAARQPLEPDLRFVTLALKMVTDLERIGDAAVNVCERAISLSEMSGPPLTHEGIETMATTAQRMVREAIDAFVNEDAAAAEAVVALDNEVDDHYHRVFRELLERMVEDSALVARAISLQSAAKFLERIGDHAVNLAEMVVFMVRGKDIRHLSQRLAAVERGG